MVCGLSMIMIAVGPAASQPEFPQSVPPECAALAQRHGVGPVTARNAPPMRVHDRRAWLTIEQHWRNIAGSERARQRKAHRLV
jgi:hypothetical protein